MKTTLKQIRLAAVTVSLLAAATFAAQASTESDVSVRPSGNIQHPTPTVPADNSATKMNDRVIDHSDLSARKQDASRSGSGQASTGYNAGQSVTAPTGGSVTGGSPQNQSSKPANSDGIR